MINLILNNDNIVINIHFASTAVMVGVIWVIQLLHYPTFHYIEKNNYSQFQKFHMNRISYIVIPAMVIEMLSGIMLVIINDDFIISFSLLVCIWIITFVFFTNIHQRLLSKYENTAVEKLVNLNWIRTTFWTVRLVILFIINI
tara:strand:- start:24 stop:452 length:429 start_codon:yes stop_codon:yes gene_type:complete